MRYKYIGILNLVLIAFYLIRPSMPYIEYIIHKDYIEKNLCVQKENPVNTCHGKCYLHERLKKQSEHSDENSNNNKLIPENKMYDHFRSTLEMPLLFGKEINMVYCYINNKTVSVCTDVFVPPRA